VVLEAARPRHRLQRKVIGVRGRDQPFPQRGRATLSDRVSKFIPTQDPEPNILCLATNSTPPTPQLSRRKLELLPRSGAASTVATPLASPSHGSTFPTGSRANPFGTAKSVSPFIVILIHVLTAHHRPVDVSAREREVEERISKERDETSATVTRHPVSRETSRQPTARGGDHPHPLSRETSLQASTRTPQAPRKSSSPPASATVRPAFSFANAAKKAAEAADAPATQSPKEAQSQNSTEEGGKDSGSTLEQTTEKVAQLVV
jgi:translation initiation factor 4B